MKTFKKGQELSTSSIGDHNCIYTGTVLKVTAKTVTVKTSICGVKRCKIHSYSDFYDGDEFIYPHGQHSFAPIFRATA